MSDLISILMPVKDAGKFLTDCLDSILQQDIEHWELVAINDHSSDDSATILKSYSEKDARIKTLNNRGEGIIDALRLALEKSKGAYITRMDADDMMADNKLSELHSKLTESGERSISIALVKIFSEQKLGDGFRQYQNWLNELAIRTDNYSEIYKECVIPSPCWMIHRKDLLSCGAFDRGVYPEDYDLCFRFYEQNYQVVASSKTLHYWRDHIDRTSRTDEKYRDQTFFPLKMEYFLKLDYDEQKPLVLWGAGRKGKLIAQLLIEHQVAFDWVCDNSKKEGKSIYDVNLQNYRTLDNYHDFQLLVALSAKKDQEEVQQYLSKFHFEESNNFFFFC